MLAEFGDLVLSLMDREIMRFTYSRCISTMRSHVA